MSENSDQRMGTPCAHCGAQWSSEQLQAMDVDVPACPVCGKRLYLVPWPLIYLPHATRALYFIVAVFVLVAAGYSGYKLYTIYPARTLSQWTAVPAQVETAEIWEDSRGVHTEVALLYESNGTHYTCNRLTYFQSDAASRTLVPELQTASAVNVYVHPTRPRQSVYSRRLWIAGTIESLWMSAFLYLFVASIPTSLLFCLRRYIRLAKLAREQPAAPWNWIDDPPLSLWPDIAMPLFGVLAILSPALLLMGVPCEDPHVWRGEPAIMLGLLLLLLVLAHFICRSINRDRGELELDSPHSIGGRVSGTWFLRKRLADEVQVILTCREAPRPVTSMPDAPGELPAGAGEVAVSHQLVAPERTPEGARIRFDMPVPAPNPESLSGGSSCAWRLVLVSGSGWKSDTSSRRIPVFHGEAAGSPPLADPPVPPAEERAPAPGEELPPEANGGGWIARLDPLLIWGAFSFLLSLGALLLVSLSTHADSLQGISPATAVVVSTSLTRANP